MLSAHVFVDPDWIKIQVCILIGWIGSSWQKFFLTNTTNAAKRNTDNQSKGRLKYLEQWHLTADSSKYFKGFLK